MENGIVKGHFKDGKAQEFSPVDDVDPDTFDAANYLSAAAGEDEDQNMAVSDALAGIIDSLEFETY